MKITENIKTNAVLNDIYSEIKQLIADDLLPDDLQRILCSIGLKRVLEALPMLSESECRKLCQPIKSAADSLGISLTDAALKYLEPPYCEASPDDNSKLGDHPSEDIKERPLKSVSKRLLWLCVLLVMGLLVSAVVGRFESVICRLPVIMCFQSLILDMAGNVGTQSLAVAIRVLADGRSNKKNKAQLVFKELRVGLINGALLGSFSVLVIGFYLSVICRYGAVFAFSFSVSSCLGVSMFAAMSVSALFGTVIPIFFESVGIDPAVASGPLITTVNDLAAVVAYYGLSWLILINLLNIA